MIREEIDDNLSIKNQTYRVIKAEDVFLLKKISIVKKPLLYAFIGGMWYSNDDFSLENKILLPYPFTTYYTTKILDKQYKNTLCRSLYYVKMPIIVLQFEDECICIEFDPTVQLDDKELIPFISLSENEKEYIISFYLFNEFFIREKECAWLGFGKKRRIFLNVETDDTFQFSVKIKKYESWIHAVQTFTEEAAEKQVRIESAKKIFEQGKQALFRSYDHLTGSFLQLPWRKTTGFTFVTSSYTLLSYEAVRLHYFTKWQKKTEDKQFLEWSLALRNLFLNPKLYKTELKRGEGLVWYNMSNLTRHGLEGFFYMDCGYGGYPGGQGTIAFHLLKYLEYATDKKIENLTKKSLEYILSTQNKNGSWPMALRQEGMMKFRPETLSTYETHGGTAECVRALIAGYKRFKDDQMKNAALKAVKYLDSKYPICYNGLRDIGINEPEAFSAVSIIDAYLDYYEFSHERKYLDSAIIYAYYTLTWIYFYETRNLKLKYNFHPISYSITPRLSPYESTWIVSTYLRLYNLTGNEKWEQIAKTLFKEATGWITENGGLCEGVFPSFLEELKRLPMEQTFATVELLQGASNFFKLQKENKKEEDSKIIDRKISVKKEQDVLVVFYEKEIVMKFDIKKCKVTFLRDVSLNNRGISFSFSHSYSIRNRLNRSVKKRIRGKYGKNLLGISEVKYFLKGVYGPREKQVVTIKTFENYKKIKADISIKNNSVQGYCKTDLHSIEYIINITKKDKKLCISFNPLVIKVLDHDIDEKQVLFPVVGASLVKRNNETLYFDGFSIVGDFRKVIEVDDVTVVDQTLATNWTHGGVYKGVFDILLEINQ